MKIPNGCWKKTAKTLGGNFFAAPCRGQGIGAKAAKARLFRGQGHDFFVQGREQSLRTPTLASAPRANIMKLHQHYLATTCTLILAQLSDEHIHITCKHTIWHISTYWHQLYAFKISAVVMVVSNINQMLLQASKTGKIPLSLSTAMTENVIIYWTLCGKAKLIRQYFCIAIPEK